MRLFFAVKWAGNDPIRHTAAMEGSHKPSPQEMFRICLPSINI